MHDGNDDSDEHSHKDNCFVSRTEPNDDKRTECNFGKRIENDDIRFQYTAHGVAPPECKRNQNAEHNGNDKTDERFQKRNADMIEQRTVVV